jgi:hypothetical protein
MNNFHVTNGFGTLQVLRETQTTKGAKNWLLIVLTWAFLSFYWRG